MNDSGFSEKQIVSILKQADEGVDIHELCREHDISLNTFYTWKARHGGMESLLSRLNELETENYRLKECFLILTFSGKQKRRESWTAFTESLQRTFPVQPSQFLTGKNDTCWQKEIFWQRWDM